MAKIDKRQDSKGNFSYRVQIRKKGNEISKTFKTEEDAKLYVYYKERLIDNMENFEVPIEQRITLQQIYELKIKTVEPQNKRQAEELRNSYERISSKLPDKKFYHEYTFEDWIKATSELQNIYVYRGSKSESAKRLISLATVRRILANASSAISYAQKNEINIENYPLQVIQQKLSSQM